MVFRHHEMTTYNRSIMKFKKLIYFLPLIYILGISLLSCSDELATERVGGAGELTEGITLYIPGVTRLGESNQASYGTRAGKIPLGTGEAECKYLHLLAINSADGTVKAYDLKNMSATSDDGYSVYKLLLDKGNYFFYLLGNIVDYLPGGIEAIDSKDNIDNALLNFGNLASENVLQLGNLPMACLAQDMRYGNDKSLAGDNALEIKADESISIYADLKFLCSKVRYTLLLDMESEDCEIKTADVDFVGVKADNVQTLAYINGTQTVSEPEYLDVKLEGLTINAVEYPEEGSPYFNISEATEEPEPLTPKESDFKYTDESQRAWQGIAYLPENLNKERTTQLLFTVTGTEVKTDEDAYSLSIGSEDGVIERGKNYDVVAKVVKSEGKFEEEKPHYDYFKKGEVVYWYFSNSFIKSNDRVKIWGSSDEGEAFVTLTMGTSTQTGYFYRSIVLKEDTFVLHFQIAKSGNESNVSEVYTVDADDVPIPSSRDTRAIYVKTLDPFLVSPTR